MTRLLAACLFLFATSAWAQSGKAEAPDEKARAADKPAEAKAEGARDADTSREAVQAHVEKEQVKREVLEDVRKALEKQKEEIRDEVRAQLVTQSASRALDEEPVRDSKRKLELFEIDGYFRVRPDLFHHFSLGRGTDPAGYSLFPMPLIDATRKTQAGANMRWRLEPTLNVSEDVRLRAQVDLLDNILLGSTPDGTFPGDERMSSSFLSQSQVPPTAGRNALAESVKVRRVWGEVTTPVGLLRFGRMASQWGLGVLTSDGNGLDSDFGDSVDRFMFVTKFADHYVVPMIDFTAEGISSASPADALGQPFDRDQLDDARSYILAIAKRDTDLERDRKLAAGKTVVNYGLYFAYRTQAWDAASYYAQANADPTAITSSASFVPRSAYAYVPDLWFRLQTPKLRLEAEVVGVYGKIGNHASTGAQAADPWESQTLTLQQLGGAAQGEYKVLDTLGLGLELGFASGDKAWGMGNKPGRGATKPGSIDGQQYCVSPTCDDRKVTNFRFNRDYRIDLILWREILGGITDAVYVKPGLRYEVTEGLALWLNIVYSRAIYGESTPSANIGDSGLVSDPNLGIEIDGGLVYDSGDGFVANLGYGALFPLGGLRNNATNVAAGTAQALRAGFTIRY